MSSQIKSWVSNPAENHGPLISAAVWSLCGISGFFLGLRLWIQQGQGKLWYDSLLLTISWVFLLAQVVLVQLNINMGFGKHSFDIDFSNFERITYYGASGLSISVVAITLSKISFGVTLYRLTEGWVRAYVCFAIATLFIFAVPVAVIPWVLCKPLAKTFVDIIPGTCVNKEPSVIYGRFQAVWSAIMDISLALIPWKIIWNLQMRTAEKIGVGIAMSLGVLAGITAVLRGRYVEQLAKQDLSYDATKSVIWSSAEAAMAIVATSIPVLRVFFKHAVNTAMASYQNSSRERKMRTNGSNPTGAGESLNASRMGSKHLKGDSTLVSTNKRRSTTENVSQESLVDVNGKSQEAYLEMDNLIVDPVTGRVTLVHPGFTSPSPDDSKHHRPHLPV